ncbi:MAG: phage tail tape measure protein [bacterium]|nr:phage tail tape measure protein [bacterium]
MAKELELAIRIAGRLDGSLNSAVSQAQAMMLRMANTNVSTMNRINAGAQLATKVGSTILKTVGAATVAGFTAAAAEAGKLNKAVANIGTLSVGMERQQVIKKDIQEIAVEVGKDTSDIADGTYQVVSAYGDAADTMDKVKINAKAARAGLSTTNDSIALTTAITKAYGDTSAAAVQHVADLAFKTVELGQTTFPELSSSMGKVASLSTELGVSQEELFASYATLTGVTGDAAGVQTQMMAIYNALLKPNKAMTATIQDMGYASGYSMIKTLGLAGTLKALDKATGGSSERLLELYSNQRAMPAILALTGAQAETYAMKLEKMKNVAGATDKAFETQTQGIAKTGFTLDQAKVKMQVAAQKFGGTIAPMVGKFADVVSDASDALSNMDETTRENVASAAMWTTGAGAALMAGGKITTGIVQTIQFLTRLSPAMTPVIAGLGTIAALTVPTAVGISKIIDENVNYTKSFHKQTEELGKATAELIKYNNLSNEVAQYEEILSDPQSSVEQIDAAKTRLEEIAQMLGQDYSFAINCDTSALDAAIAKKQLLSRSDVLDAADKINDDLGKNAGKYRKNTATIKEADAAEPRLRKEMGMYEFYDTQAQQLQYDFTKDGDKATYIKKMNELYQNARLEGIEFGEYKDIGNVFAANQIVSRFEKSATQAKNEYTTNDEKKTAAVKENAQTNSDVRDASLYYSEALANDVQNGRSYETATDIKKFQAFGKSAREAGINTAELATKFAAAAVGYTDFSAAISDGKVGEMTSGFIDFNHDIGETAENTVQGAALISNGFENVQQAIEAGAPAMNNVINDLMRFGNQENLFEGMNTSQVIDKVTEMANAIGLLPDGKAITLNAEGNFEIIDEAAQKITEIDKLNTNVTVSANGDVTVLNKAAGYAKVLQGIGAVSLTVNADGNIDILNQAGEVIATIDDKNAQLSVNGSAPGLDQVQQATEVQGKMEDKNTTLTATGSYPGKNEISVALGHQFLLHDKDVKYTITTEYKTIGTPPGESATGQKDWRGGLTYVNDQSVQDPREVIEHNGMRYWYEGKNILANVPKGARIYNASESRSIIDGSHRAGLDRVPFDGYIAELHAGERVLTEREAADFDGEYGLLGELLSALREALQSDSQRNVGGGMQITYSPVIHVGGGTDNTSIERSLRDDYDRFKSFFERMTREENRKQFA